MEILPAARCIEFIFVGNLPFFLIDARAHFRFFIKTHFCTSYSAFDEWFWDRNSNWQVHCIAQHLASLSSPKQVLFKWQETIEKSERASIQSFEGVRTWNWSLCSVESIALQSELKISDFRQVWENLTMPYFLVSPQYYIISEVWIMRWLVGALLLLGTVARGEDEAEGEDGVQFEDDTIYRAVIESCSGWRLNKVCEVWNTWKTGCLLFTLQLPEVKNFIYGDFESKFDRTVFKKIPGKAPELIFFTQAGKEVERLNIEKFSR